MVLAAGPGGKDIWVLGEACRQMRQDGVLAPVIVIQLELSQ